ncbi:pathogenesis-related protein 17 [Fagus crenata]
MSSMQLFYVLPFFLLMVILNPIHAVDYLVINNATVTLGGAQFGNEIGVQYTEQTLQLASEFIWQTFKQAEYERKYYPEITMVVTSFPGITSTQENYIRFSSDYIQNYVGDVRIEVIGVLYHETARVGNGIADYIRLKAGWASPHWVQRGSGLKWDEGFAVTAYFLEYCNALNDGFVAELNALMKYSYSNVLFVKLTGKSVDELWNTYKAHYE